MTEQAISDFDLHLFGEGNHQRIYDKLGAHPCSSGAASGAAYGVAMQLRPENCSIVAQLDGFRWHDSAWLRRRAEIDPLRQPDAVEFGGSGYNGQCELESSAGRAIGHPQTLRLNLPPLGAMFFAGP